MTHATLIRAIRLALAPHLDLVMWQNQTGAAKTTAGDWIRYGVPPMGGGSDLVGILEPEGRWFCIEVKTPRDRLRPKQKLFLELIRDRGGFAAVVRAGSEDEAGQLAVQCLERARKGERE